MFQSEDTDAEADQKKEEATADCDGSKEGSTSTGKWKYSD